jgi:hypothetical protein
MSIKASGSTSSAIDQIRVASPPSGGPCPKEYPGFDVELQWIMPLSGSIYASTPTYDTSFYFLEGSGVGSVICGYLTRFEENKENYTGKEVTLASTELQVVYGPSTAEVEATEAAKRKYEEEAPVRQAAKEAAEAQAKKAAEAKAKEVAEQASITFLWVKTVSHRLGSTATPGATEIEVGTNQYANVTVTIEGHGWTRRYRASAKARDVTFNWSCQHTGTRHYIVTAVGGSGPSLRRSGQFGTVSSRWCAETRRYEAEANRQTREEKQHAVEGEQHQAEEKHRREVERFETNCRKLGGTPIELQTSEGSEIYCRGKNGGVIQVPH